MADEPEHGKGTGGADSADDEVVVDIGDLVKDVPEPEPGPVTREVVEVLRQDPELAEVAEIAEKHAV